MYPRSSRPLNRHPSWETSMAQVRVLSPVGVVKVQTLAVP
jgi:hypothetical protein